MDRRSALALRDATRMLSRAVLNDEADLARSILQAHPKLAPAALRQAAREKSVRALEAMLPLADPSQGDSEGWTPLAYAIANGFGAGFDLLLAASPQAAASRLVDGSSMLTLAVKANQPAMVAKLWGWADPHARDEHGRSALDWAGIKRNDAAQALQALGQHEALSQSCRAVEPKAARSL